MANRSLTIIDGDEASNALLKEVLEPQGFNVTTYARGAPGLDAVLGASPPPVLVLLCLELPDMSGYVVCKKIKENPPSANVPIIIMSADATEKDFERHRKLKVAAQDYIKKPFENAELLRKVENLVGFNIEPEAYESIESKLDSLFEQGTTDDELRLRQEENERLRREIDSLRDELLRTKQQMGGGAAGAELQQKVNDLQAERDRLAKRVEELQSSGGNTQQLEQELARVKRERDELKGKFEFREQALKELNEYKLNAELELQQLRGEVERLQGEGAQGKQEAEQFRTRVEEMEAELNRVRAEADALTEKKRAGEERLKAEMEQLREELTQIEEEAQQATSEVEAREQEIRARAERREHELLQQIEDIREQTEMMREDYERQLAEMRNAARRVLEEGLAALGS